MKEKQITMSLELAKSMFGKDEAMDMLIKQHFSNEDLGIKPKLPKKWKDLEGLSGFYINTTSRICAVDTDSTFGSDRNTLPTKELAEAMLAMCQLLYLRDIYNDGWVADWKVESAPKYIITNRQNQLCVSTYVTYSHPMAFKTSELRDEFLTNFRDLLEIAKPLL